MVQPHLILSCTLFFGVAAPSLLLAQDSPAGATDEDVNEFFAVEDFEMPSKLTLHGTFDFTYIHFDHSQNLDGFPTDRVTSVEPKLVLRYEPADEHVFLAEVELDGLEEELELEQLSYQYEPAHETEVGVGIQYIPFGIERFYNSPARNPLVDRPSPYRHILPGTYSDLGVFLSTEREWTDDWSLRIEAALTRSLEGPTRDDRPHPFDAIDQIQPSGRIGISTPYGVSAGVSGLLARYEDGAGGHEELTLTGVDLTFEHGETIVRAEAIFGEVGRADSLGGDYDRYGWYVEAYHRFPRLLPWGQAIETVVRYDDVDMNDSVRDFSDVRRYSFGVNWVLDESWRMKTEVSISREDGESVANDGRFIQLEYHF